MTEQVARSLSFPSRLGWTRGSLVAVVLSAPVVLGVFALRLRGDEVMITDSSRAGSAIFGAVSAAGFCAVAVALLRQGATANGWTSLLAAVIMIPESLVAAGLWGWPFFIGTAMLTGQLVPVLALLLRYPGERLNRANRLLVFVVAAVAIGLPLLNEVNGLEGARGVASAAVVVTMTGTCLTALFRLSTSAGVARRRRALLVAVTVLVALAGATELVTVLSVNPLVFSLLPLPIADDVRVVVTSLVPLVIAADLLRRRAVRAALGRSVLSSFRERDPDRLRHALRTCLADPHLQVWVPGLQHGTWLDLEGRPVAAPDPSGGSGRRHWAVHDEDGRTLALIDVADRIARDDPDLLVAALDSARVGFENARLDAHLSAQILELDASRARIVAAADNERRAVQRELVDGPQARLAAADLALMAACGHDQTRSGGGDSCDESAIRTGIAVARMHVQAAVTDLRELARGVYPALLSQGGLGPALRALPEQLGLPVSLSVSETIPNLRLRPAVEYTAYLAVIEWITGAGGTRASQIVVDVSVGADRVEIRTGVTAPPSLGSMNEGTVTASTRPELSNSLRDRILALGGSCDWIPSKGNERGGFHVIVPGIP